MGDGVITAMQAEGVAGKIPFTGQDAQDSGLARILLGQQCMTVFKDTALEAALASKLAIALIKGTDTTALVNTDRHRHRAQEGRAVRGRDSRVRSPRPTSRTSSRPATPRLPTSASSPGAAACKAGNVSYSCSSQSQQGLQQSGAGGVARRRRLSGVHSKSLR